MKNENWFHPPYNRTSGCSSPNSSNTRIAFAIATIVTTIIIIICSLSTLFSPSITDSQAAIPAYQPGDKIRILPDLMEGAPKQGIVVDRQDFCNIKPIFTTSNSNIKMLDFSWYLNKGYTILYDGKSPVSTSCGEFSLRWNNIGIDEDGEAVDIVMRVSNIIGYGYTNPCFLTIGSAGGIEALGKTWASPYTSSTRSVGKNSFDVEYFMYKHQEDSNSSIPANGNWVIQYVDIDQPVEDIRLKANYEQDIHVIPDDMKLENRNHDVGGCWLTFSNLSTEPYIKIPKEYWDDNSTLHSGFCLSAKNGYKFGWEGYDCGTAINEMYGQSKIIATHDEGGVITDVGTTEVAWKHDKTYTVTADKHHTISSIIIDGKEIPITDPKEQSYTFKTVTTDHTIHTSFILKKYHVIYDANIDEYTGDTPDTEHTAGTNAIISDNGFARDGYAFVGWNTASDGTGDAYVPGDEIFLDDADVILYAQWKKLVSVTFIDSDGTVLKFDGEVMLGGDSAPPEPSKRVGYMFTGWLGTYQGVEKDEIVRATWKPIEYKIVYDPNGGEGIDGQLMPEQKMTYDEEDVILENEYTRTNYEFIGWNTQPDGSGTSYATDDTVMNLASEQDTEIVLYAQWKFYIQMPETGEFGAFLITSIGILLVGLSILLFCMKRRGRR